jgi:hypothetical protein
MIYALAVSYMIKTPFEKPSTRVFMLAHIAVTLNWPLLAFAGSV